MDSNVHTISQLHFEIQSSDGQQALKLQNDISEIFQTELETYLEELMDSYNLTDKILEIDRIDIDLGEIKSAKFKDKLVVLILEEFKNVLDHCVYSTVNQTKYPIMRDQKSKVDKANFKSPKAAAMEIFYYYLLYGHLPYFSAHQNWNEVQNRVSQKIKEEPITALAILRKIGCNEHALRRIRNELSPLLLEDFIDTLFNSNGFCRHADYLQSCLIVLFDLKFQGHEFKETFFSTLLTLADENSIKGTTDNSIVLQRLLKKLVQNPLYPFWVKRIKISSFRELFKQLRVTDEQASAVVEKLLVSNPITNFNRQVTKNQLQQDDAKATVPISTKGKADGQDSIEIKSKNISKSLGQKNALNETHISNKEGVYLHHAGLILFHPFLKIFFEELGLLENESFKNLKAQWTAARLLDFIATGTTKSQEPTLVIQKFLCGIPVTEPMNYEVEVSHKQTHEAEQMMEALIKHWSTLKNTSIEGLRETFIQRNGKLTTTDDKSLIQIERQPYDILLDKLPWNLSTIKLPWIEQMINVEW